MINIKNEFRNYITILSVQKHEQNKSHIEKFLLLKNPTHLYKTRNVIFFLISMWWDPHKIQWCKTNLKSWNGLGITEKNPFTLTLCQFYSIILIYMCIYFMYNLLYSSSRVYRFLANSF